MQTEFGMGVSLLKREDESLQNYFLSFSPMAPFFGVQWRFMPVVEAVAQANTSPAPAMPSLAAAKARDKVVEDVMEVGAATAMGDPVAAVEIAAELAEAEAAEARIAEAEAEADAPAAPPNLMSKAPARPDDLTALKGVGEKLAAQLNELGLHTFAQIAELTPEHVDWLDAQLTGVNKGRAKRGDWIAQAEALREN